MTKTEITQNAIDMIAMCGGSAQDAKDGAWKVCDELSALGAPESEDWVQIIQAIEDIGGIALIPA